MKIKPSKRQALEELWRRGNLSWKLKKHQKELYDLFHNTDFKTQTWLLSRRSGKSFVLSLLAIEECIKTPNTIIKFLSPTKLQVNNNVRPIMKKILEDCPEDLKPTLREKDYIYYFTNGSEIQLAGTDNGHAEKLRGGDSHISIIDEAQSCDELKYIVKSILLPTTLITKGKVLLAGTPPKNFDHDFIDFIEEAEMRGSLIRKTIYDNVMVDEKMLQEIMEETGGVNSEDFQREYLCKLIKDANSTVIPEADDNLMSQIVKEWPKPPHYDAYVSMDLGFKDLTGVLFGYYDFRADKIIIEDEYVIKGSDIHLPILSKTILDKEKELWYNHYTNEIKKPYLRVSDINYIVLNDLRIHSNHELDFKVTAKDDKESAINTFRVLLSNQKIIIHPKCETLIRHIKNAKWSKNKSKREFARSPDDSHYDLLDAAIYLVRNVAFNKNPYPAGYEFNNKDLFVVNYNKFNNQNNDDLYRKIFNIKRGNK